MVLKGHSSRWVLPWLLGLPFSGVAPQLMLPTERMGSLQRPTLSLLPWFMLSCPSSKRTDLREGSFLASQQRGKWIQLSNSGMSPPIRFRQRLRREWPNRNKHGLTEQMECSAFKKGFRKIKDLEENCTYKKNKQFYFILLQVSLIITSSGPFVAYKMAFPNQKSAMSTQKSTHLFFNWSQKHKNFFSDVCWGKLFLVKIVKAVLMITVTKGSANPIRSPQILLMGSVPSFHILHSQVLITTAIISFHYRRYFTPLTEPGVYSCYPPPWPPTHSAVIKQLLAPCHRASLSLGLSESLLNVTWLQSNIPESLHLTTLSHVCFR